MTNEGRRYGETTKVNGRREDGGGVNGTTQKRTRMRMGISVSIGKNYNTLPLSVFSIKI